MYFTKLTLRSVTFVPDAPRLGLNNLYKIAHTTPWISINSDADIQPIYNFKLDVLTPAPRDSHPNGRGWLVFEGPISADTASAPITVHATASNYYHEIPLRQRFSELELFGHLIMVEFIDENTISAKSFQLPVSNTISTSSRHIS
jgi:hypothetical protein